VSRAIDDGSASRTRYVEHDAAAPPAPDLASVDAGRNDVDGDVRRRARRAFHPNCSTPDALDSAVAATHTMPSLP